MVQVAEIENGQWHVGIGDPDFVGWLTMLCYFLAAVLCLVAFRKERRFFTSMVPCPVPYVWLGLAVLMFLLGCNKQLDLQTWLIQTARDVIKARGHYDDRRTVWTIVIACIAVLSVGAPCAVIWLVRNVVRRYVLPIIGLIDLGCFVLLRAATFHHIERMLGYRFTSVKLNVVVEFGGIVLVSVGALRVIHESVTRLR